MISRAFGYAKRNLGAIYSQVFEASCVSMERPIFIWGTGRCGTHLLYDILSLHPDLCFPNARERWKKGIWGSSHYGDTTPEELKDKPIPVEGFTSIWMPGNMPDRFLGSSHISLLASLDQSVIRNNYANLKRISRLKKEKNYRILDKCPTYIMVADVINTYFPDSYHIFCIRDPRAVVNSILRLMRFTAQETSGKEYGDGFYAHIYPDGYEAFLDKPLVETLCWQMEQLLQIGLNYRSILGDRLILFRYESLLQDVYKTVPELCAQLDLPNAETLFKFLPEQFPDYNPAWPESEDFEANKEISFHGSEMGYFEGLHNMAEQFGYDREKIGCVVRDIACEFEKNIEGNK